MKSRSIWIDVNKQMPPNMKPVLLLDKNGGIFIGTWYDYEKVDGIDSFWEFQHDDTDYDFDEPVAWMPLPEYASWRENRMNYRTNIPYAIQTVDVIYAIGTDGIEKPYLRMDLIGDVVETEEKMKKMNLDILKGWQQYVRLDRVLEIMETEAERLELGGYGKVHGMIYVEEIKRKILALKGGE